MSKFADQLYQSPGWSLISSRRYSHGNVGTAIEMGAILSANNIALTYRNNLVSINVGIYADQSI